MLILYNRTHNTTADQGYKSIGDFRGKLKPYDRNNKPADPAAVGATGGSGVVTAMHWAAHAMLVPALAALASMAWRGAATADLGDVATSDSCR